MCSAPNYVKSIKLPSTSNSVTPVAALFIDTVCHLQFPSAHHFLRYDGATDAVPGIACIAVTAAGRRYAFRIWRIRFNADACRFC